MAKQARKSSRNPELKPGVRRFGHSRIEHKRARFKHAKKGDTRTAAQKQASLKPVPTRDLTIHKFYSPYDTPRPLKNHRTIKSTKLRRSLQPGKILIVLAGPFAGRRVVLLKQLGSGLLLVTGPYSLNGVPLRRLNSAYVIGTSTKVDISKVDVSSIDDKFFAKTVEKKQKGEFIEEKKQKKPVSESRKSEQSRVDGALTTAISAVPQLTEYLKTRFSLSHGQRPHFMRF